MRVLQAADRAHQLELHVERQAGRDAVRIDLVRRQPLGLEEDLMARLAREAMDLVLDRRAVARADALDHARCTSASDPDPPRMISCVRSLVCVIQHGSCRGCMSRRPRKENTGSGSSPGCSLHDREVDAVAVEARRRPGLQAPDRQLQLAQPRRERDGRRIARAPRLVVLQADMDQPGKEGPGGQHDRAPAKRKPELRDDADHAVALEQNVVHRLLEQRQIRLVLEARADRLLVEHPVGLRAGRAHRRPLGRIQGPELDARLVGRQAPWRRPARRFP